MTARRNVVAAEHRTGDLPACSAPGDMAVSLLFRGCGQPHLGIAGLHGRRRRAYGEEGDDYGSSESSEQHAGITAGDGHKFLGYGRQPSKIIWSAQREAVRRSSSLRTVQVSSGSPNTQRAI